MMDCSVLIMSCDKNHKLLSLFLDFFSKNWSDCPYPVYVSTEKRQINHSLAITLNSSTLLWGQRLLECLETIPTEFVILVLDDFLIEKSVNSRTVFDYVDVLKQNALCMALISENGCVRNDLAFAPLVQAPKYIVSASDIS